MAKILLFDRLSACSRRALLKKKKRFGHPHKYSPQRRLLNRLSRETGLTPEEVLVQLRREKKLLSPYY